MANVLPLKPGHFDTTDLTPEEVIAFKKLNAHLVSFPAIPTYDLALQAYPEEEEVCRPKFDSFRHRYRALPDHTRQGTHEILANGGGHILVGVDKFIEEHRLGERSSTVNAFVGGGAASVAKHSDELIKAMGKVEFAVRELADAKTGTDRALAKRRVKLAYAELNKKFGPMLKSYLHRSGPREIVDRPVYRLNRAVKLVKKGVDGPLFSTDAGSRILRVSRVVRFVSRGTVILDLGFRVENILNARNHQRQAAMETMGLAFSFEAVEIGSGIAVSMALGPVGWIIAICLLGVAAYETDEGIKLLTKTVWNETLGPRQPLISWNRP